MADDFEERNVYVWKEKSPDSPYNSGDNTSLLALKLVTLGPDGFVIQVDKDLVSEVLPFDDGWNFIYKTE